MASLRPCPAVRFTAPASSNLTRSQPRYGIILPLDRSNTMLKIRAPLDRSNTLLKISHGIRSHSGDTGHPFNPDPEGFTTLSPEHKKIWERIKKIAKGPPDMPFREEIDIIDEYLNKARDEIFKCESILHANGAMLTWKLCRSVRNAVVMASKVVDCAVFRLGSPDEISLQTTKQMVQTYVSVFVAMAEDIHHKEVKRKTIVSLVGAIQGVASVEMNNLKDKLATARAELLVQTVYDALIRTEIYVRKMTMTRKLAIVPM